MDNTSDINTSSRFNAPLPPSSQINPLAAIQEQWAAQLETNISTITQSKEGTDKFKADLKRKIEEIQLPHPNNDLTSKEGNAKEAFMNFAALLALLESLQNKSSEEMSKSMANLSVTQAQFGALSADSTYSSDMENAKASLIQGIASIVGGGVAVLGGFAGGFMDALTPAAEEAPTVDDVGSVATTDESTPVSEVEEATQQTPVQETTDSGGEDETSQGTENKEKIEQVEDNAETGGASSDDDVAAANRQEGEELQAKQEKNAEEIENDLRKKNPTGEGKAGGQFNQWRKTYLKDNKTWANIAKFLSSAPQSFSPLVTGIGSTMSVQQQEAGAAYKRTAGIDQVTQGLAQSAYQATQSTVGNTDKLTESLIRERQELLRQNAAVTQYKG